MREVGDGDEGEVGAPLTKGGRSPTEVRGGGVEPGVGPLPEQTPIIELIRRGGPRMASFGGCWDTTVLKKML